MDRWMKWLVLLLFAAVIVLAVALWNTHKLTKRIENYIIKPDGLNAWMQSEPTKTRHRIDGIEAAVAGLCKWSQQSAPANMKCSFSGGPPGTVPKDGPTYP